MIGTLDKINSNLIWGPPPWLEIISSRLCMLLLDDDGDNAEDDDEDLTFLHVLT